MDIINTHNLINTIVYSGLGVLILVGTFFILDIIITRYNLWKEIVEKQNVALSILLGAFALGISFIIAAAVHG